MTEGTCRPLMALVQFTSRRSGHSHAERARDGVIPLGLHHVNRGEVASGTNCPQTLEAASDGQRESTAAGRNKDVIDRLGWPTVAGRARS